jgi:hypothetical protein
MRMRCEICVFVQCVVRGARNKRRRTSTVTVKKKMLQSKPLLNFIPPMLDRYVRDAHYGAVVETAG